MCSYRLSRLVVIVLLCVVILFLSVANVFLSAIAIGGYCATMCVILSLSVVTGYTAPIGGKFYE